jgi:outer membrane protein
MKFITIAAILLFTTDLAQAQDNLTLSRAIEAALEHNHRIQISSIEQEKTENLATRGNAGQLPTVSVNSDLTGSYSDLELTPGSFFRTIMSQDGGQGQPGSITYDGVTSTGFSAGIGTQFTIYDGLKGRFRYKLLQSGNELSGLQFRSEMESTVLTITRRYMQVVSIQKAIKLKELALQQSSDRYKIIETRREYGQANEQQQLQALADLKTDSTEYRDLKLQYENAYRELHTAIGWNNRECGALDEEIKSTVIPTYDELLYSLHENNTALHVREKKIEQARINQKLTSSNFLPTVTVSAQYGYNYQSASDGQFETQEQLGLMGGISLKIPLFTGGRNRTSSQNAKASVRQEQIRTEESRQQLQTQFDNTWQELLYLDDRLLTEKENLHVYERNFERARDSFERGLITGVELRTAQLSLQDARLRLSDTELQMKLTETTLLYLSGGLLVNH